MLLLEDLDIYKMANEIAEEIWTMVSGWDYFSRDTLEKQLVRAADSISFNIAEGYGRFHFKENKNFCYFSRGSAYETKNGLGKALNRNLIETEQYTRLTQKLKLFLKKLNKYIQTIGAKDNSQSTNYQ